jgi:hypothetical protein
LPGLPSSAYSQAGDVLRLARAIIDDAYSINGQVLTGTTGGTPAPITYPFLNAGLRTVQRRLRNSGVETLIKETIITPLTVTTSTDPTITVALSDSGYFDGVNNFNPPQLPTDLVVPLVVWQRPTGAAIGWGDPMPQANDGLPSLTTRFNYFRAWEWLADALVFNGASQSLDIRLRYDAMTLQVAADTDPIPLRDGLDAVACATAWQYLLISGDPMIADKVEAMLGSIIHDMANTYSRKAQRGSHRRRSWRRGRGTSSGWL